MVVVVALFRPDALMNRVYPEFSPIAFDRVLSTDKNTLPMDRSIRLHVTRETEYGDRYKLFVIAPPGSTNITDEKSFTEIVGIDAELEKDGRLYVSNTTYNGLAEKAGLTFGDFVTAADVEQTDRPAKEWIYPIGFLLLGIVLLLQMSKARREEPDLQSSLRDRANV